jgi:hypothetical protein
MGIGKDIGLQKKIDKSFQPVILSREMMEVLKPKFVAKANRAVLRI